jgi:hypothetical protein
LIELAGEQAIDIFCRHALSEESTATRWCIARALRLISGSERLRQRIQEIASAQDRRSREVAVEISGWQSPGFMQNSLEILAREDFADTVSQKASEALLRQDEQRWVEELMGEFQANSTQRRWSLLTSIIELGDPFLLTNQRDRLWLGQIIGDATEVYWPFIDVEVEKRKRILLEQAKRLDRKR